MKIFNVLIRFLCNHKNADSTSPVTFQPTNRLVLLLAANVHISIVMWRVRTGCVGAGGRFALKMIKMLWRREVQYQYLVTKGDGPVDSVEIHRSIPLCLKSVTIQDVLPQLHWHHHIHSHCPSHCRLHISGMFH